MKAADTLIPQLITALISEQYGVCGSYLCRGFRSMLHDWEQGAREEGDFWDLVEQDVKRRFLRKG